MAAPSGPAAKTERLLNLVLVLLYTRRPLPKAAIRTTVPQYGTVASDEAFERMFERDKEELRELGVPLVTEDADPLFDDEPGYRIHQRDYALPDIAFEADELAVLGLAGRVWAQASLAGPAAQALRKLQAAGVERDTDSLIGIEPRLRTAEPAFDAVKDAVLRRVPVSFHYRRPEHRQATTRRVQPWSLLSRHGHWYLTAFDLDREAARVFRLSRVEGAVRAIGRAGAYEVPEHDARVMVGGSPAVGQPVRAVLRVREGAGHALRRAAAEVAPDGTGWSRLALEAADVEALADDVAGYAADVVALEPPELRDAVLARLRGVLTAAGER
ncbi:MAG TPA: WYL domain-containing protein [Dermatophilaceae bacterium]|nr:WYL domain-containing protein [Dermatophilaceae bacterium]